MSDIQTITELQAKILELEAKIRYGLVWEDKPEAVELECQTKLPTLISVPDLDVPPSEPTMVTLFDDPTKPSLDHLLIEADNYHALKVLQYTHANRIDVIYIDPPYNTGNKDFVYNDNYVDKEDSFRHSKWLSFMSKRLEMAKNLLSDKGVIFMSIDDNEQAQLKLLCDRVFGENNFVNTIIWRKKYGIQNDAKHFSTSHEYILCYAKNMNEWRPMLVERTDEQEARYSNSDNDPRGAWTSGDLSVRTYNAKTDYPITTPTGKIVNPPSGSCWRVSKEKFEELLEEERIYFSSNGDGVPRLKRFLSEVKDGVAPTTFWDYSEVGHTDGARKKLKDIFGGTATFDYPKPIDLIKRIVKIASQPNSIILDFMAGSGTTGQAVLELNAEDGGTRQCILITNNESNGVGSKLIAENPDADPESFGICRRVTQPRLRKIIEGYVNTKGVSVEPLSGNKLRYFKADFVEPLEDMEDDTMLLLAENALGILKVKENCFDFVSENRGYWSIHRNATGLLAIYYAEDMSEMDNFKAKVEECLSFQDIKIAFVYIFSFALGQFNDFFDNNQLITVKDFPEPLLRVLGGKKM
jgi:adenine-specific DNA-methyltransferase